MKKLLAVLASVFLALSLSACDVNINVQNPTSTTTTTKVEQTQKQKKTKKNAKNQNKQPATQKATQSPTAPAPVTTKKQVKTTKTTAPANKTSAIISQDKAKQIALSHAGVSASDIFDFEIERDREGGKHVYEISFETKQKEYEYEILASTGEILHSHAERQDRD